MKTYLANIEQATLANHNFREVVFTTKLSQVVLMSLLPGEEIGLETHEDGDQFFRFEAGEGKVVLADQEQAVSDGAAVVVPAGVAHNVINTSNTAPLKFYTIYTPPEHKRGTVHATRAAATADQDHHFDGQTSL